MTQGIHGEKMPLDEVVKIMDVVNVKKIVILTGMWGEKLHGVLDKMGASIANRLQRDRQCEFRRRNGSAVGRFSPPRRAG
jgi:hypothetical protein